MRDPDRISRILGTIEKIWRDSPDLRLGQLLANASTNYGRNLFYYEDSKLEDDLNTFVRILESYGVRKVATK